jgi:L-asparaginase
VRPLKKPKVLIVSTGGTIASKIKEGTGYSPVRDIDDLLSEVTEIGRIAEIQSVQFCNILSFALTPQMVIDVIKLVKERLQKEDFDGAVIIQGTATMEESSYLADLLWDIEKPLVFTGAMLNASERDWDGGRNLFNSVMVAVNPEAMGKGVMVCMAGEIHAARDVMKIHKTSLSTFVSLNTGPLGIVNKNGVIFYRQPLKRMVFKTDRTADKVDIIKVALGADSRLLEASISSGSQGIVIEALPGGGGVTPSIFKTIKKARQDGVIFVMTPRSPIGSTVPVASGGCGPWDLKQCGVIMGGDLSSVKARILLMVALPIVKGIDELEAIFKEVAP